MRLKLYVLIGLALLGWVASVSADSTLITDTQEDEELSKVPKIFDYGDYVAKYKKNYSPVETLNKARLFFGRTIKIFQHNVLFAKNKKDYFLKQTEFTDLTPKELRKNILSDMEPVAGADKYPDMPADQAAKLQSGKVDEIDSMAGAEEPSSDPLVPSPSIVIGGKEFDGPLNMLSSDSVGDVKDVISMLKMQPKLAKKLAKMVDDKDPKKRTNQLTEEQLAVIRKKYGVNYVPVVPTNNKDYDPLKVQSMASTSIEMGHNNFGTNYAQSLMDGFDLGLDIKPYPLNAKELDEREKMQRESPMSISNLFGSVGQIFGALTAPFSEDEDTEESSGYIEPAVVIKDHFVDPGAGDGKKNQQVDESKKTDGQKRVAETKYDVDWRRTGCITNIKSQKDCDSCYAFTVVALMEYFYCCQTKKLTDFSPQYVVDCGGKTDLHGCRGGTITNVGRFVKDYGLELNTMYPYTARDGECPYDKQTDEKKANGYIRPTVKHWTHFAEINAWYKWLPRSPLVVGINMPSDFHAYGGGVHDGLDCLTDMTHAMLLVGSGTENGKKFWLLKNSYSDQWGETGYFRISHSAPLRCFNSAFVIRVNFDNVAK